jgi:hypothetical protein
MSIYLKRSNLKSETAAGFDRTANPAAVEQQSFWQGDCLIDNGRINNFQCLKTRFTSDFYECKAAVHPIFFARLHCQGAKGFPFLHTYQPSIISPIKNNQAFCRQPRNGGTIGRQTTCRLRIKEPLKMWSIYGDFS